MKQTNTLEYKGYKMVQVHTERRVAGKLKRATRTKYYRNGEELTGHFRWLAQEFLDSKSSDSDAISSTVVDWDAFKK